MFRFHTVHLKLKQYSVNYTIKKKLVSTIAHSEIVLQILAIYWCVPVSAPVSQNNIQSPFCW